MSDTRKFLNVFIASPSDLSSERKIARSVVDNLNRQWGKRLHCHLELVGWEDTLPGSGRPQAVINKDLERCDFFIGLLWSRWGTPTDSEGIYTSGFEEEYRRSVARHQETGKPEISLYFKKLSQDQLRDPGPQLQKVLEFRDEVEASRAHLYKDFEDEKDFESRVRDLLTSFIQSTLDDEDQESPEAAQASDSLLQVEIGQSSGANTETRLSNEGLMFMRSFIEETDREDFIDDEHPLQIARVRLLASILKGSANDEITVGAHDANLLYKYREESGFSLKEKAGLLRTGLANFSSENVPVWCWVASASENEGSLLSIQTLRGLESERIGALSIMRLLRQPLAAFLPRTIFVSSWLAADSATGIVNAALRYLSEVGIESDVESIRAEYDRNRTATSAAAAEAIIRILLKSDYRRALEAAMELRPSSLSDDLAVDIISRVPQDHQIEHLENLATSPAQAIRLSAARELQSRAILSERFSRSLLSDEDPEVRRIGISTLITSGRTIDDSEIRQIAGSASTGVLSNIFTRRLPSNRELDLIKEKNLQLLRQSNDDDLQQQIESLTPLLATDAFIQLAGRQVRTYESDLRSIVDDKGISFFEREMLNFRGSSESAEKIRGIEESIRKELVRGALNILCQLSRASDFGRIRQLVIDKFVDVHEEEVEFIGRYGSIEDLDLLLSMHKNTKSSGSLLFSRPMVDDKVFSTAILSVGRADPFRVLSLSMPGKLRSLVVVSMANSKFASLGNDKIYTLLDNSNDRFRKAVCLKSIVALSKARVKLLHISYIAKTTHFYNVIHWLDLALSLSRDVARWIAKEEIKRIVSL